MGSVGVNDGDDFVIGTSCAGFDEIPNYIINIYKGVSSVQRTCVVIYT